MLCWWLLDSILTLFQGMDNADCVAVPSGVYLHDSQIKEPSKAAQDMEMAGELWIETEKQLAEAEKKLKP